MHKTRREVLKGMSLAAGGLAFSPFLAQLKAEAAGSVAKLPKRFVFVTRSNGFRTYGIAPQGLEGLVAQAVGDRGKPPKTLLEKDLTQHALNESMAALEPFKKKMNIVNGLSARVCNGGGHGAGFGALGAYSSRNVATGETIDGALANTHPGVFKHLGFKVDKSVEAKISRPHVTAFGAKQRASFYCNPSMAYGELFGSIAQDKDVQDRQAGDKALLDFLVDDTKRVKQRLNSAEKEKLDHYLGAFESLADRRVKLAGMTDALDKHAPEYSDKYSSEIEVHRLEAHFDMAAAALIAGLTNVITLRVDDLDLHYHGLKLGHMSVHTIGHIETDPNRHQDQQAGGEIQVDGIEARRMIRKTHFDQVAELAAKLDAVPEGDGTMLDNTLIVVLSDHGSQHHPSFEEFPFITIGNVGGAMKTGQYLHYPNFKESRNRTHGTFYTTLMHAAGAPRDGFGQFDPRLPDADQTDPLAELLA